MLIDSKIKETETKFKQQLGHTMQNYFIIFCEWVKFSKNHMHTNIKNDLNKFLKL